MMALKIDLYFALAASRVVWRLGVIGPTAPASGIIDHRLAFFLAKPTTSASLGTDRDSAGDYIP